MHPPIDTEALSRQRKLQALGLLAGGMAHDFNNILAIIDGYASLLAKQAQDPKTELKLKAILEATGRAAELTHGILAFGRTALGGDPACCDLREVINKNRVLLKPLLSSRVELILHLPETPVIVPMAEDSAVEILLSLAANAREALKTAGTVTIELIPAHEKAILLFSDSGQGLGVDRVAQIFRNFPPQAESRHMPLETAFGLKLAAQLMRRHHGSIDVRTGLDPIQNKGTEFTLVFPRLMPHANARKNGAKALGETHVPMAQPHSLKNKTVLVVDDEEALLPLLEKQLNVLGMKVLKAANADSALLMQENYRGRIDFLLTDVVMPGVDGLKLAEMMVECRPDMNVVYMSGQPHVIQDMDFRGELPDKALIVPKPLRPDILSSALQQALEHVREL